MKIAQYISGASEYNLGISARERTATGANATTQSSQKRLSPFMSAFVEAVTEIAKMWLRLMQDNWTYEKYIGLSGASKEEIAMVASLTNAKLTGAVGITLNLDSMISSIDELLTRNMLEIWNQMQGRGLLNEKEFTKELMKARGLKNPLLVMSDAPEVSTGPTPPDINPTAFSPTTLAEGQALTEANSIQTNL